MTIASAPLNLLAFPQRWDGTAKTLRVRFLCLPRGNPLDKLGTNLPTFAEADLKFQARLIGSLANLPRSADAQSTAELVLEPSPTAATRKQLFEKLKAQITIDPKPAPAPAASPTFRKPSTESYRILTGGRRLSDHLVDDGYRCALDAAHQTQPPAPELLPSSLRWGQVIALAVKQPNLARALGLLRETTVTPPANFFARGGWLWITLSAGSTGASTAGLTVAHAARIPPLAAASRPIFTPVLFPIDRTDFVADDVFREAERYDNGYARLVHGTQNQSAGTDGDGIRLAWDDEQLAEWFNRQVDPASAAPMGTSGFRIDVRDTTAVPTPWNSLQRINAPALKLGDLPLGAFTGDGVVEVAPARLSRTDIGRYWMPPYFTTWRGTSLVATDRNLRQLHRELDWSKLDPAVRLNRDSFFTPIDDTTVRLLYGHRYEFRVRMCDLAHGGPNVDETPVGPVETTTVAFLRRKPPGPVTVTQRPSIATATLKLARPLLAYPEYLYTSENAKFSDLRAALQGNKQTGLALPDPDVAQVKITVQVRGLAGDKIEWQDLYPAVTRPFTANEIEVPVTFVNVAKIKDLTAPLTGAALTLPTARDVRLVLVPLGRTDANYFADAKFRDGPPVTVDLNVTATEETELIPISPDVTSFFLRQPPPDGSVARPVARLGTELVLDHHELTLAGRPGSRTVFGCSAHLRHSLSPEASAITFSTEADVTQRWVHALRFTVARDWTWRGLAADGLVISRRIQYGDAVAGPWQVVGTVTLPTVLSPNATRGVTSTAAQADPPRQTTNVVFFDAHDPKPDPFADPPQFPTEQRVTYKVQPKYVQGSVGAERLSATCRVPATTPPAQVPELLSMGIALQELPGTADEFATRRAVLWVEFAEPPRDPNDEYFVRPLVAAPDPLLIDRASVVVRETAPEPALPIDPEWVRMIKPNQATDDNGFRAMQHLPRRAEQGQCYLVPLPEGVDPTSPELFNMYTYEIRVGHKLDNVKRWCTANGRFGPALRVTGIKHPAPQLMCQAQRGPQGVLVRAPFATPTFGGRHVRPVDLKTRLWAMIYARVRQADGLAWRYLLIGHVPLAPMSSDFGSRYTHPPVLLGEARISGQDLRYRLRIAGLPPDTSLAVLATEAFTEPTFQDPVGDDLGFAPLLRTSALVKVPESC